MYELKRTDLMVHEDIRDIIKSIRFIRSIINNYSDPETVINHFKALKDLSTAPYKELREAISYGIYNNSTEELELELIRLSEIAYYLEYLLSVTFEPVIEIS